MQQLEGAKTQMEALRRDNLDAHDKVVALERELHSLRNAQKLSSSSSSLSPPLSSSSSYQQGNMKTSGGMKKSGSRGRIETGDASLGHIAMNLQDEELENRPLMEGENENVKEGSTCCCCIS